MQPYQIALLILGIIVGVYLLAVVIDFLFVSFFLRTLKKHAKALAVMLQTKFDNIKKLLDVLNKYSISVDFKYIKMLTDINPKCFVKIESSECSIARSSLSYLRDELVFLAKSDEKLSKHSEINSAINNITEMDNNYRILVATYNADVIGYNYWIHFLPTRYIYKLAKTKNKQIIA